MYQIIRMPGKKNISAEPGANLLEVLRQAGEQPYAPCGGKGTCGKCAVLVDGVEMLACRTCVDRDMTVTLLRESAGEVLTEGVSGETAWEPGLCLALDIGTTTVAAYLTQNGKLLAAEGSPNPQTSYGADVISRIRYANQGGGRELTQVIRRCVEELTGTLTDRVGGRKPDRICLVGNPAMQQLFLGLPVENLVRIPFRPLVTEGRTDPAGLFLKAWEGAQLLTVPAVSGYLGADTLACILASGMDRTEELSLLVDIGTNGEMVMGTGNRLVACATAAGPALEGAGIRFGMMASKGAIDRVDRDFSCRVIGEGDALGICGSGLVDAVAVALEQGLINERGRVLTETREIPLTRNIFLTQEDIRQLQQAKGAIAAGIRLMTRHLGVELKEIKNVWLAGAFGSHLDPHSACRIGLLPEELEDRIQPIGNAAGSGARLIAGSRALFAKTDSLVSRTEVLELSAQKAWARTFADEMRFRKETDYLCRRALAIGFAEAAPAEPKMLLPRGDVRDMCAADKCGAYGKNWTCPPYCGSLEECESKIHSFAQGILVQTVGTLQKTIDTKAYRETERRHLERFYALLEEIKKRHPQALGLASGGCRVCKSCAYPEPCRFPEKACSSMEGYGLFVTQVCRDHGIPYHHGDRTVTYTACILF